MLVLFLPARMVRLQAAGKTQNPAVRVVLPRLYVASLLTLALEEAGRRGDGKDDGGCARDGYLPAARRPPRMRGLDVRSWVKLGKNACSKNLV